AGMAVAEHERTEMIPANGLDFFLAVDVRRHGRGDGKYPRRFVASRPLLSTVRNPRFHGGGGVFSRALLPPAAQPEKRMPARAEIRQTGLAGELVELFRQEGPADRDRPVIPGDAVAEQGRQRLDAVKGKGGPQQVQEDDAAARQAVAQS